MGDNQKDRDKIQGHRKAIHEHKEKYRTYIHQQDKDFALKTIQRVQKIIADLKRGLPGVENDPLDTWAPPKPNHY